MHMQVSTASISTTRVNPSEAPVLDFPSSTVNERTHDTTTTSSTNNCAHPICVQTIEHASPRPAAHVECPICHAHRVNFTLTTRIIYFCGIPLWIAPRGEVLSTVCTSCGATLPVNVLLDRGVTVNDRGDTVNDRCDTANATLQIADTLPPPPPPHGHGLSDITSEGETPV